VPLLFALALPSQATLSCRIAIMIVRWFLVVSLIMSLTQGIRRLTAEQRMGPSTCMHEHVYTGTGSWHPQPGVT
jgi:hypothetical protein